MKFKELEAKIIEWGVKRDLYHPEHGANALTQLHKFFEEFGELNQAILNNDVESIKDAIGDCQVCLIHRAKFLGVDSEIGDDNEETVKDVVNGFNLLPIKKRNEFIETAFKSIVSKCFYDIDECIADLECIGYIYNFKPLECLNHAYNEIKDRKGKMINGTFVKE